MIALAALATIVVLALSSPTRAGSSEPWLASEKDQVSLDTAIGKLEKENDLLRKMLNTADKQAQVRRDSQEQVAVPEQPMAAEVEQAAPANPPLPPAPRHGGHGRVAGPTERQQQVIGTFKWAWKGYKDFAWGHDELLPVSKKHSEWFHLGLTLVDSLDTMMLMGLEEEYNEARDWVAHSLDLNQNVDVNLFECTIRVLGGLLSMYSLSGKDEMYLEKAKDLGDRLLHAFNDKSGVPFSDVNLKTLHAHKPKWGSDSSTSEITTIQLEFRELSRLTGDPKYDEAVTKVMLHVKDLPKTDGLVPIFINANSGKFSGNTITLGARGDSYYEYLLKQWIQSGKRDDRWKEMYLETVDGIFKHLVKESSPNKFTYIGELKNGKSSPKMDHLVCFLPGTLAIGADNGLPASHLDLAKKLVRTCVETYKQMPLGLAPEITHFNTNGNGPDLIVKDADAHNLLRPETVESLWIMHRITKDPIYVEWGWEIYLNFEKWCRVNTGGYSSLVSVKHNPPKFRDKMESFFLGETLKYLYLLFEEGGGDLQVPLDQWVFNTEAHPMPIFGTDAAVNGGPGFK
jgi:mannosyl-oligosaccharide alpha-1,2-mannosidase